MEEKKAKVVLDAFFNDHKPQEVRELAGNYALEYLAHSPNIPTDDQKVFNILHSISNMALAYQKKEGGKHEQPA